MSTINCNILDAIAYCAKNNMVLMLGEGANTRGGQQGDATTLAGGGGGGAPTWGRLTITREWTGWVFVSV